MSRPVAGLSAAAHSLLLAWAFLKAAGHRADPPPQELVAVQPLLGRAFLDPACAAAARKELVGRSFATDGRSPNLRLTPAGARRAKELYRDFAPLRFEELLAATAGLPAYARHLADTHPGAPAGAFGMLDGVQVRAIEDALGLSPAARVLELGAGNAGLALHLARRGARVTAVDRAAGAMARLGRAAARLDGPGSVRPLALDLDRPEAVAGLAALGGDEPWDAAVAVDVFDFLERLEELLRTVVLGGLRPGGRAVLVASEGKGSERLGDLLRGLPGEARIDRVELTAVEERFWQRQLAGLGRWTGAGSRAEDDLLAVLTLEAEGGRARMGRGGARRTLWRYAPTSRATGTSRQGVARSASRRVG